MQILYNKSIHGCIVRKRQSEERSEIWITSPPLLKTAQRSIGFTWHLTCYCPWPTTWIIHAITNLELQTFFFDLIRSWSLLVVSMRSFYWWLLSTWFLPWDQATLKLYWVWNHPLIHQTQFHGEEQIFATGKVSKNALTEQESQSLFLRIWTSLAH